MLQSKEWCTETDRLDPAYLMIMEVEMVIEAVSHSTHKPYYLTVNRSTSLQ